MNNELKGIETKIENLKEKLREYSDIEPKTVEVEDLSPFVNPHLINSDKKREALVEKGVVELKGCSDRFIVPKNDREYFPNGTECYFWIIYPHGRFVIAKKDDVEIHEEKEKKKRELQKELSKLKEEKEDLLYKVEVEEFWDQYDIPFAYGIQIKPVKSGYTESSWGDGSNRSTVWHIVLNEDVSLGRLKRDKGEFLCSQPTFIPYSEIEPHKERSHKITCKACLDKMKKFLK